VLKERMTDVTFLDKAVFWANLACAASVCFTLMTAFVAIYFSHYLSAAREAQVNSVQMDSQQRIRDFERLVATANERAAAAAAEAAKAESETASMTLAHEKLRKENLLLSTRLEEEKQRTLEAEERIARLPATPQPVADSLAPVSRDVPQTPRLLTTQQEQVLVDSLAGYRGSRVSIIELGDPEAGQLAQQITRLLQDAGWTVVVSRFGALVPPQHGVVCTHASGNAAGSAFVQTLRKLGTTVHARSGPPEQFEIIVGLQPS
jgi:hypothetical protein